MPIVLVEISEEETKEQQYFIQTTNADDKATTIC